jgi:hypothetical protein
VETRLNQRGEALPLGAPDNVLMSAEENDQAGEQQGFSQLSRGRQIGIVIYLGSWWAGLSIGAVALLADQGLDAIYAIPIGISIGTIASLMIALAVAKGWTSEGS